MIVVEAPAGTGTSMAPRYGRVGSMPDWWLHRLVVQGPRHDVTAFRRAATASRSSSSEGSQLSFRRLMSILPSHAGLDENLWIIEPLDLSVDPTSKPEHDMAQVVYDFQLRGAEIEPLLVEVSCR